MVPRAGSGPTNLPGSAAPWVLPKECPPAIRATVSSSFIAMGPTVQRGKPLRAGPTAATPVRNAVRAGAVPGHADKERSVVSEVGRPPVLRGGHQSVDVVLYGRQVEILELGLVVE